MRAMKSFGINIPRDGSNGRAIGAFWVPNSLDPRDETRSYAKTAYYEPSAPRQNYHLVTQKQVTKILIDKKKATGVIVRIFPLRRVWTPPSLDNAELYSSLPAPTPHLRKY